MSVIVYEGFFFIKIKKDEKRDNKQQATNTIDLETTSCLLKRTNPQNIVVE